MGIGITSVTAVDNDSLVVNSDGQLAFYEMGVLLASGETSAEAINITGLEQNKNYFILYQHLASNQMLGTRVNENAGAVYDRISLNGSQTSQTLGAQLFGYKNSLSRIYLCFESGENMGFIVNNNNFRTDTNLGIVTCHYKANMGATASFQIATNNTGKYWVFEVVR